MIGSRRSTLILAVVALAGTLLRAGSDVASGASAQLYPNRPIKLIVPVLPGGPMDVMSRLIAQQLSATLGQQVVVENRVGGGTTLGGKAVATADPDGYTLLLGNAAVLAI